MRLRDIDALIDDLEYPTTTADIVAAHGEHEVSLSNGDETLGEVLSRSGEETFAGPDEVRMTFYGSLTEDAIGRKGYTDRDPPTAGEVDAVSF